MQTVEVNILGKKFYLKSDDPQKLLERVRYLESNLEELNARFNTVDQTKLYVLYSLTLLESYLTEVEKNKELNSQVEKITELMQKLEKEI
ncbi:MAG: cell division protein ZapA [Candidatus Cloacimonetes bacterium]|nr:cell division protein ZapA [Candidatus Cloacimonadota bacterium]